MGRFDGRVALVTGSASGIGAATAQLFAAEGASVVVNSVRSVEEGEALAASLPSALYHRADVSIESEAIGLVDAAVDRFGSLDILVNNAGTTVKIDHDDLASVTEEVWERIFRTNVLGNWFVTKAAVPALKASGHGAVVNVASVAGVIVGGSSIPYATSKAALIHLTKCLAVALGPEIRVNAVAPGLVATPWTKEWGIDYAAYGAQNPAGKVAEPEDVATTIAAFVSELAVSGEFIVVDGGRRHGLLHAERL
jgi:ketoreductase RED2